MLAGSPATARPSPQIPQSLLDLDWNGYMKIRFLPAQALWAGERFSAEFFHLGYIYRTPVHVFRVDGTRVEPHAFSPQMFDYADLGAPTNTGDLGFAGMRVHTAMNDKAHNDTGHPDELIVFHGASYFRPLAKNLAFGLSGRGLAIDTGEPGAEEFPVFSEMYMVHPQADDHHVWILALLESRRATGAYAFNVSPGDTTLVDVTAHVYLREQVKILGLSPLTSMYLFGEDEPARFGDHRPEVHDSDALEMVGASGERVHRPLRNPPRTIVSSHRLDSPRGFGLVQRDRRFESYQDLVERYEDRPSAWIEPRGDWGKGVIRTQEMATPLETDDNIAMMWVPDTVPAEGVRIAYRMHIGKDVPGIEREGHVVGTRLTRTSPTRVRFTIDFALPTVPSEGPAGALPANLELAVTPSEGTILSRSIVKNSFVHGVRASFEIERPDASKDVELRAFLKQGEGVLSETWSYGWPAKI